MRRKISRRSPCVFVAGLLLCFAPTGLSQSAQRGSSYPTHLPYTFDNAVWWSDSELRTLLKQHIPTLGNEIAPSYASESKIRTALTALLKARGIVAEIQSEDPSPASFTGERDPDFPPPSIKFSVLSPQILVDKLSIYGAPSGFDQSHIDTQHAERGEYSAWHQLMVRLDARKELQANGYLDGDADIDHDAPRREGDHYLTNLRLTLKPGLQYHVAAITIDGGPLLQNRDLSAYLQQKPGDVAGLYPFGHLPGAIRGLYTHAGYSDVDIEGPSVIDREHALVSYHLTVDPGPLYHLRSLTIRNLDSQQQTRVTELIELKTGEIFDETAISKLYGKIHDDPLFTGLGFTFSPAKDKAAAMVDVSLDFFVETNRTRVTVK